MVSSGERFGRGLKKEKKVGQALSWGEVVVFADCFVL